MLSDTRDDENPGNPGEAAHVDDPRADPAGEDQPAASDDGARPAPEESEEPATPQDGADPQPGGGPGSGPGSGPETPSPLFDALSAHRTATVELVYQLTRVEESHRRLTRDLVDVFDHFVEVERLSREGGDPFAYQNSIRLTINKLHGLLNAQRILVFGARGEIARPTTHEIVGVQYHPDAPDDTVLQVHHHGIQIEGRVERPASVTVSTRKKSDEQEAS